MNASCPVCLVAASVHYAVIDGFDYLQCSACGSLHIRNDGLDRIDAGETVRVYDRDYWCKELKSARERAESDGLVRAGEAILYSRRVVRRFLDVGTGPGYLLEKLSKVLPDHADMFYGIELYPPDEHTDHPNYRVGDLADLGLKFDGGVCIEVIEHLTPRMLARLAEGLAALSNTEALWLFNTGMPAYVMNEDPGYLDPLRRGHIVSYSLEGVAKIFEPHGFVIRALPGKTFAFLAEFEPPSDSPDFDHRIYHPLPENRELLQQCGLMYQAVFEAARSYFYQAEYVARTDWALRVQSELDQARALFEELRATQADTRPK